MRSTFLIRGCSSLVLLFVTSALAQLQHDESVTTSNQSARADASIDAQDVPEVPGLSTPTQGWDAGITFSGVHQSTTGWATLATPSLGYTVNDIFSADATLPIYFYRLAESLSIRPKPDARLVDQRGEPADLIVGLHAQFLPPLFAYQITGAFTVPTGDKAYGLSTGRVTFDINNRFDRTFGRLTPNVEIGGGDSTTLVNRIITKNYTSLGPLAHFQTGLGIQVSRRASFESDAYEQLPIGDQKIYGPSRKGKPTVVVGQNVSEDNGFINALDIAFDDHVTLSGYYSRSLRLHADTAAVAITYVLRAAPLVEDAPISGLFR